MSLLDVADSELSMRSQTALLGLNRTSRYDHPVPPSAKEVALKHQIDAISTRWPCYGVRRITAQLRRDGWRVNHKAVARHRREMGVQAIAPGPNLSKRAHQQAIYPYLLAGVTAARPNHIWGIDITYIRLRHSWLYLVVVLDWHARYVVSWQLDQTLAQPFVTWTVQQALGQATPEILTSDQGSHFTSPQYTTLVEAAGVRISMDGRGRALDTVFTERLWRTIKYEAVSLNDSATPREARMGLSRYFQFPNHQRVHQALGYRTPAEVYFEGERGSPLKPTVGWS